MQHQWPPIGHETHKWVSNYPKDMLTKRQQESIKSKYKAAVPLKISALDVELPRDLQLRVEDLLLSLARFDTTMKAKPYSFPTMLLRSESAASSQIENLTSSVKNIALAQISNKAPANAQLVAGNVAAMQEALKLPDRLSVANILKIHKALLGNNNVDYAEVIRDEQVWIGGSDLCPAGALFVPVHHDKVKDCFKDFESYAKRTDVNAIVKAAVIHSQFETIHPFVDGNGRVGRTLLHKVLRGEDVLRTTTLPISAGLLHDVNDYYTALDSYRAGDPIAMVEQLVKAIELAVMIGSKTCIEIETVLIDWEQQLTEPKTASIYKLLPLLVEQPVVNSDLVATRLSITTRAANNLFEKAQGYGILKKMGHEKRGVYYQAKDIIDVFNKIADIQNIRRMFHS
ncbi:MAG: Fic family protein [Micrococcaceae bacterium]